MGQRAAPITKVTQKKMWKAKQWFLHFIDNHFIYKPHTYNGPHVRHHHHMRNSFCQFWRTSSTRAWNLCPTAYSSTTISTEHINPSKTTNKGSCAGRRPHSSWNVSVTQSALPLDTIWLTIIDETNCHGSYNCPSEHCISQNGHFPHRSVCVSVECVEEMRFTIGIHTHTGPPIQTSFR